jgi:hypothetical protein
MVMAGDLQYDRGVAPSRAPRHDRTMVQEGSMDPGGIVSPRSSLLGLSNDRRFGFLVVATTGLIVAFALAVASLTWTAASASDRVGADFRLYLDASQRFAAGDGLYPVRQLAGPYQLADGDILYPPPIVLLMLPFTVLPAILFWAIPLVVIAAVVIHHRPALWSWPLMALGLAYPVTSLKIVHGNPTMWIVALIALGTVTAGPAVFVLLKPTMAPFALIGVRHRRWWLCLALALAVGVLFLPLWQGYLTVLANTRGRGLLYSLDEVPFALVPIVAWIASPSFRWPRLLRRVANHRSANVGDNRRAR